MANDRWIHYVQEEYPEGSWTQWKEWLERIDAAEHALSKLAHNSVGYHRGIIAEMRQVRHMINGFCEELTEFKNVLSNFEHVAVKYKELWEDGK